MRKLMPLLVLFAGFAFGCGTTPTPTATVVTPTVVEPQVSYKNIQYLGGASCNGSSREVRPVEFTQYPVFWDTQEGYENLVLMFSPAVSLTTPHDVTHLNTFAYQLSDMLNRSGWYNVTDLTQDSINYTSFQKDSMIAKVSSALTNNKASALIVLDNVKGEPRMEPNPACHRPGAYPGRGGYGYGHRPGSVPPPSPNCEPIAVDTYKTVMDIADLSTASTVTEDISTYFRGSAERAYYNLVPQKRNYPLSFGKSLVINSRRKGELAVCEFGATDNIKMTISLPEEFRMNRISLVVEAACQLDDVEPTTLASFYWQKETSKTLEYTGQDLINAVNCADANGVVVMNVLMYVEDQFAENIPILLTGTPNGAAPVAMIEPALVSSSDNSNATLVSTFTKIVTDIDVAVKALDAEMKKAAEAKK
ncbi:MAG: hypothetical protein IJU23_05270 [Proteobacteria bacterium]|nr:hypothetical protein [Pseudomonadota bacterium]